MFEIEVPYHIGLTSGFLCVTPKQVMKFVGFVTNFDTMSVYLPGGKMEKIAFHCKKGTFTKKSGIKGIN